MPQRKDRLLKSLLCGLGIPPQLSLLIAPRTKKIYRARTHQVFYLGDAATRGFMLSRTFTGFKGSITTRLLKCAPCHSLAIATFSLQKPVLRRWQQQPVLPADSTAVGRQVDYEGEFGKTALWWRSNPQLGWSHTRYAFKWAKTWKRRQGKRLYFARYFTYDSQFVIEDVTKQPTISRRI